MSIPHFLIVFWIVFNLTYVLMNHGKAKSAQSSYYNIYRTIFRWGTLIALLYWGGFWSS